MRKVAVEDTLRLIVGRLQLNLDASEANISMSLPPAHQQFNWSTRQVSETEVSSTLYLKVHNKAISPDLFAADCLCKTEIFEIYQKSSGELITFAPRQKPPRAIVVDKNFLQGEIIGDFSRVAGRQFYPIQYTDIVFFSNWLAHFGDLILHASGVALDGQGYCFVGPSGAGKSTLVDALAYHTQVNILGEDQVILRYLGGRFWIFGTPWHEKPERCSPIGVPLNTLFFLVKHEENHVMDISESEGFKRLMGSAFIPYYRPNAVNDIMATLNHLAEEIPFKEISFILGTDVLPLIL